MPGVWVHPAVHAHNVVSPCMQSAHGVTGGPALHCAGERETPLLATAHLAPALCWPSHCVRFTSVTVPHCCHHLLVQVLEEAHNTHKLRQMAPAAKLKEQVGAASIATVWCPSPVAMTACIIDQLFPCASLCPLHHFRALTPRTSGIRCLWRTWSRRWGRCAAPCYGTSSSAAAPAPWCIAHWIACQARSWQSVSSHVAYSEQHTGWLLPLTIRKKSIRC